MKVQALPQGVLVTGINDFDLEQTLDCGQCFRFNQMRDGVWHGVAKNLPITISRTENGFLFENIALLEFNDFWKIYFDLDRDYAAIRRGFPDHPALNDSTNFASGVRILRQDAWEALISFIISQNNNVKRIKGIVDRLCRLFGETCGDEEYSFPSPAVLSRQDEAALQPLRCGWRAAYILDAARRVASGQIDLTAISVMPIQDARKALQTINGVGPKVAECVLLYGMARLEAFPLDVWMKRAMTSLFPGYTPESFGDYSGIAQQYIFHYCRSNPTCFQNSGRS